jgi:hypothetical protein
MRSRLTFANVASAIALAVAVAGGTLAFGGGRANTGKIRACVTPATGDVRILSARDRCDRKERSLVWNKRGRRGPAGPPGQSGAPGANGADGAMGPTGPTGPQGTARGFARVAADGTLDAARSFNVTGVVRGSAFPDSFIDTYLCFDLGFEAKNVVVTPDMDGGRPTQTDRNYVFGGAVRDINNWCPDTHKEAVVQLFEYMHSGSSGFSPGIPFFVMFN